MPALVPITPCSWYEDQAEEAARRSRRGTRETPYRAPES